MTSQTDPLSSRPLSARERRRHRAPVQVVPPGLPGGQYRPLREAEIRRIHEAALTVLERTGIEVLPSRCRDVFEEAGARIDTARNRVHIPRAMVEDAIASAAKEVRLCGREERHDLALSDARVYMGTGGSALQVMDLDGTVRPSTLADVARIARLVDALPNIHFYQRACVARDIPLQRLDLNTYYASLSHTTKHVTANCFSPQTVKDVVEMAALVAGSREALLERPLISFVTCWVVSPLRYAPDTVAVLEEIVAQGMPVFLSSAPQAGATAPAALAGTLVQILAEELSGLVYTNLLRPGAPVILGFVPLVSDLRTGRYAGGAPEYALMNAAAAQLGQFYGIPVYNSAGLVDSKVPDIQAGYEKGISDLAAALAGGNFIHHAAGFLEDMITVAYEQYVIDNDILGSVMRLVRGIEVTEETLSVDVIDQVCRGGPGHFLGTRQSLHLMRTEYYYPEIADRRSREAWMEAGAPDMRELARQRAREILDSYFPSPLPPEIDRAIRSRFPILLPEGFV